MRHHPYLLSCMILIVILAALFAPVIFMNRVLIPSDILHSLIQPYSVGKQVVEVQNHFVVDSILQYYVWKSFQHEQYHNGSLPLWNPYIYGGYPMYANTMSGVFSITNVLLLMPSLNFGYQMGILLQLFIAGLGMFLLLKKLRVGNLGALASGIVYMLNSQFIATHYHGWTLGSFCWMPYIVLFLIITFEEKSLKYSAFGGVFLAFAFLGGSVQTAAFVFFVVATYTFLRFIYSEDRKVFLKSNVLHLGFFIGIGFLLSALMWLPTLENFFLDEGSRAFQSGKGEIFGSGS